MKRTRYQVDDERSILTACIVHDRVLARIAAKVGKEPYSSKWSNLVFKWCSTHFKKYEKAPNKAIVSYFRQFAEKSTDEATTSLVEKFLSNLSNDYSAAKKEINEDFTVDQAARYFNRIRIEKQKQKIEDALERGDVEEAQEQITNFNPIQLASDDIVALLDDPEPWREVLAQNEEESLIKYPGALGDFFGNQLQREGFISFMGPEKRGKTFLLFDVVWMAGIKNKRRTLFYSVGDMSRRQMMKRIAARLLRRPIKPDQIKIPRRIIQVEGATSKVKGKTISFENKVSWNLIKTKVKETKLLTAATESTIKMKFTPSGTTRVADIENDIQDQIRHGWVPDVVVIDYADILAPERQLGEGEVRHQTDETWKSLRRLSQKYHMLVVTATQSNTGSYSAKTISRQHFSEDKRKLAHVTGMVGINQTAEEKERALYRLNWVLLREGHYMESHCVTVAGCLAIASPCIVSSW